MTKLTLVLAEEALNYVDRSVGRWVQTEKLSHLNKARKRIEIFKDLDVVEGTTFEYMLTLDYANKIDKYLKALESTSESITTMRKNELVKFYKSV